MLIDAGLRGSAGTILKTAADRFGKDSRPQAVILTHGHFDHVGAFPNLFEYWDVPVYAHRLELPHLTGRSDYPPPDSTVGKGAMALMSVAYPNAGIDLGARVRSLPDDGSVPHMPGWRWIYTPGHTAGHVSLFRDDDRCPDRGRRLRHGQAGVAVCRRHPGAGGARPARVPHAGLG